MIVGLCGTSIIGRAEIASVLITKGFAYYSALLEIEKEAGKRGAFRQETKEKIFQEHIKKLGRGTFIQRILNSINEEKVIIDSITSLSELELLKKRQNFVLVGVYTPIEIKFERGYAAEIFSHEEKQRKNQAIQSISELSELMKQSDISIIYPLHSFSLQKKIDEIIKKASK